MVDQPADMRQQHDYPRADHEQRRPAAPPRAPGGPRQRRDDKRDEQHDGEILAEHGGGAQCTERKRGTPSARLHEAHEEVSGPRPDRQQDRIRVELDREIRIERRHRHREPGDDRQPARQKTTGQCDDAEQSDHRIERRQPEVRDIDVRKPPEPRGGDPRKERRMLRVASLPFDPPHVVLDHVALGVEIASRKPGGERPHNGMNGQQRQQAQTVGFGERAQGRARTDAGVHVRRARNVQTELAV